MAGLTSSINSTPFPNPQLTCSLVLKDAILVTGKGDERVSVEKDQVE